MPRLVICYADRSRAGAVDHSHCESVHVSLPYAAGAGHVHPRGSAASAGGAAHPQPDVPFLPHAVVLPTPVSRVHELPGDRLHSLTLRLLPEQAVHDPVHPVYGGPVTGVPLQPLMFPSTTSTDPIGQPFG